MKTAKPKPSKTKLSKNRKAVTGKANEPRTKRVLLDLIQSEHERLEQALAPLNDAQLIQPGVMEDWSIRDILAHLAVWEARLQQRVKGRPERGTELGTPQFNAQIFAENRGRALKAVRADFERSHQSVIKLAESLSAAEVKHWWQAFAFNTYNHYRWARTHIRRWVKSQS